MTVMPRWVLWVSNGEVDEYNCRLKRRCFLCNGNSLDHNSFCYILMTQTPPAPHSLSIHTAGDKTEVVNRFDVLKEINDIGSSNFVLFFLSVSLSLFNSLQMNSKPCWSVCPLTSFWMCPRLPNSGLLTCPSRSGTPSWRPALDWFWEKPRRSSGNYSLWANAVPNSRTSVCPEKGNPLG